ncbi:hypothetical protein Tco_0926424 [Tanacetum coccineum]|uniref:Retrovirus-related Pol polyprotein from transposon TNT 1-94-like beta-barrel domain-containing protein n=1 Tax=Tanacetum coccineum TaxID=301880 RepID=A0ABQ5D9R7_9ASTR
MGTKVTSSSGSVLEEPEIQKLQMQAKIFRENSLNELNALKSTTQLLDIQSIWYQQAFARLFGDSFRTFKFQLSQHMNNLETLLNAETLHEMDSKSALSVIKVQFERFINSDLLKPLDIYSRSFSSDREVIETFRDYTKMTAQTFKETIIQNMNSIEQCIIERASHEQELKMTLKKLSERQLQIQQCKVQEVQSSVTSSGDETSSGIVSDEEIDKQKLEAHYSYMAKIQEVSPEESSSTSQPLEQVQNHDENDVFANVRRHSEQPESINDTYVLEKDDSNVIPDSSNICTNDNQVDQNAAECVDERAALANLIANLTLDTEENKTGVSNSNSQNIAFMSTEVKREVFENTVLLNLAHIPKGCTHASRAGATVPTVFLTQMEIICHFARECRFAKYQENRANGRNEKRIVAIEDSNSKALTHALWTRWTLMILTGANVMWHKLSLDFDDSTSEIGLISDDEEMMFQKVKGNAFNSEIVESSFEKQWIAIGSMTGDKDKLSDFKEFKGGYVAFGNDSKGGRISGKGTIKTSCLDFEKVSYVEELKFNLLSVSLISQPMLPKDRMLPKRSVIVLKNKALHDELGIHKIHPQSQIIGKSSAGFHNKKKFKTVFKPTSELGTQGTSLKALAMKVGLKRCKKNCFIQATRGIGCYVDYQRLEDKRWCGFVEVFAPVAELKHQTLFAEEVYVKQPPGFEDPAHTNKEYRREAIDNTLFIKKDRRDLMLVQVYVSYQSLDPHVFYGEDFEDLMQKEFKMRHFNKFDFCTSKPASTPIEVIKSLGKDEEGEDVDKSNVRRMSVSWRRLVLAMQETNNCGYLLYEAEYVSDEVVVLRFDITSFEIAMSKGSLMWSGSY